MSGAFTIIKTAVFSAVTEVRFYDETIEHIQERHPEVPLLLPSIYDAVNRGIISPTHIETSYKNSLVFVDSETTNASGEALRIPVRIVEGTSARLTTVYFAEPTGERSVVWRRS